MLATAAGHALTAGPATASPARHGRACPGRGLPQPGSAMTTRPNHPLPRQVLHLQVCQRLKAAHRNLLFGCPPALSAARVRENWFMVSLSMRRPYQMPFAPLIANAPAITAPLADPAVVRSQSGILTVETASPAASTGRL